MSDKIFIDSLEIYFNIGLSNEERAFPQKLKFSLECEIEKLSKGVKLEDTICYDTLAREVTSVAKSKDWVLLEDLVFAIFESAFSKFNNLKTLNIKIDKFVVPNTKSCGIEFKRSREEIL